MKAPQQGGRAPSLPLLQTDTAALATTSLCLEPSDRAGAAPAGTALWGGTVTAPIHARPFQEGRGTSLFIFTALSSPSKTRGRAARGPARQQSRSVPSAGDSQPPPHCLYLNSESKSFEPQLLWMFFLQRFQSWRAQVCHPAMLE